MTAEVERLQQGDGQSDFDVLSELLEQEGCQPDFVNAKTRGQRPPANTALHLACKANMQYGLETVVLLLGSKADVNAQDARGMTPIMCAAPSAVDSQFRHLLQARARLRPLACVELASHQSVGVCCLAWAVWGLGQGWLALG